MLHAFADASVLVPVGLFLRAIAEHALGRAAAVLQDERVEAVAIPRAVMRT